jgi:hypothetical protein
MKWKTRQARVLGTLDPLVRLEDMQPGTVVRNRLSGNVNVVIGNYGSFVVSVRECVIMNAGEWEIVKPNAPADLPAVAGKVRRDVGN